MLTSGTMMSQHLPNEIAENGKRYMLATINEEMDIKWIIDKEMKRIFV